MSGYSIKRNEILHLDSYNSRPSDDNTTSLMRQLFLDLVGDGTETHPNHGFVDVSPFITRIDINDETLVTAIIDNFIGKYYKWSEVVYCKDDDGQGTVKYISPEYYDPADADGVTYPAMSSNFKLMTIAEFDSLKIQNSQYVSEAIDKPTALYARWAIQDIDGYWEYSTPAIEPGGTWIMPVIAYKINAQGKDIEYVADEAVFRQEVTKIINMISNPNRGNTLSTNGSSPTSGIVKQYKLDNDIVTGEKIHSFWVMTNKDTPLFQAETDKCLDGETDVTSLYGDEASCATATFAWVSGNVIPVEHETVLDFEDGILAGPGNEYEVVIQIDESILNPTTGSAYPPKKFKFYNSTQLELDNLSSIPVLKYNLWRTFIGKALSNEFIISLEHDVITITDTKPGRPFTVVVDDLGRAASQSGNKFFQGGGNVVTSGYGNKKSGLSSAKIKFPLRTSPDDVTRPQIGNTYSYNILIPIDLTVVPNITEALEFNWSYTVIKTNTTPEAILTDLVDAINNSPDLSFEYIPAGGVTTTYTVATARVSGNELLLDFTSAINRTWGMLRNGDIVDATQATGGYKSVGYVYSYPEIRGSVTPLTTRQGPVAADILFEGYNTIVKYGMAGSNKDISMNFHMWKDMFFSPPQRHLLTHIDQDVYASWEEQPLFSIDSPFNKVKEITDHSMGPLVLETIESDINWQLSGKIIENAAVEKSQTWRVRFDVNRGVELRDQSKTLISTTDKTEGFEYLEVNVATQYQLLSTGEVTGLEKRDGMKSSLVKTPGFLGFIRDQIIGFDNTRYESVLGTSKEILDEKKYTLERIRLQKGFYRRSTKSLVENSYPMSYRLTVSPHGLFFHISDDASSDQADDFAWFVIQRHVNVVNGEPYVDVTAPLHCVYMSSEPPTYLSDLDPYYATDPTVEANATRIEQLYDSDGFKIIADMDIPLNAELGFPDMKSEGRFRRFVVREKNVLKPWDNHKLASINTIDSSAILHANEQLSITDRNKTVINFPNRLCTQNFIFTNSELDMIAYCDAGVLAESTFISTDRYGDNRVYESLKSSKPNGNGMRILALVQGDKIPDSDVDPSEVLNSI